VAAASGNAAESAKGDGSKFKLAEVDLARGSRWWFLNSLPS
jgi:hypothetical protein